jgi:hypothetical protein
MTYREEFPDYDPASMPAIPAGWTDISWRNDACPSFDAGNMRVVYVDYASPDRREWSEARRFSVTEETPHMRIRTVLESDDWQEVLDYLA